MTNQETIEKLNDALNSLIDAYEILKQKNDEMSEKLNDLISKNKELEFQLSDVNTTIDKRENKMDGMLNKIHKLLTPQKDDNSINKTSVIDEQNNTRLEDNKNDDNKQKDDKNNQDNDLFSSNDSDSILDIKLEDNKSNNSNANKLDLGRMESLLNGLNK